MVSPTNNDKLNKLLKSHGISSSVKIENVQKLIDSEADANRKAAGRTRQSQRLDNMKWDQYYTLDKIMEYIDYLAGMCSSKN